MLYLDEFVKHLEEQMLAPATITSYSYLLKRLDRWAKEHGISRAQAFTPENVIEFLRQVCPNTEKRHYWDCLVKLKKYFAFLEAQRLIFSSPLTSAAIPAQPMSRYPVIPAQVIERTLDQIRADTPFCLRGKAILELAYSSALRPGEIIRLNLSDIDFANRRLFIRQSKNRKDRVVPVGKTALYWIQEYITQVRCRYAHDSDAVFVSQRTSGKLSIWGLEHAIAETLKRSGFPAIKPYSMRGTAATALIKNGMGITYVSTLLGHARLTTTQGYLRTGFLSLEETLEAHHPRNSFTQMEEEQ